MSSARRSLFALGIAIPMLTGGNFFAFLTPGIGVLCFDLVAIASFASFAKHAPPDESPADKMTRLASGSVLALGIWWTVILVLRPSGPRAALEAQGIFCGILLFATVSRCAAPPAAMWTFVRGLLIGTLVTAGYGQYQYWIGFPRTAPLFAGTGIPIVQFVNANFYNANCYAAFLSAVILLGAGLAVVDRGTYRGRLAIFATVLLIVTLLLSESRSAFTFLVVATIAWLAPPRWALLLVFASLAGGAAAAVNLRELWNVGLLGRIAIWEGSLVIIRDHWLFGIGLGRFWDYFPQYRVNTYYTRYPHSFLLEVFAELGIVGVLSLLGFLGAAAVRPLRAFRSMSGADLAPILAIGVLVVHGLVDIDWHAPANPILLFVLLGMAQRAGGT